MKELRLLVVQLFRLLFDRLVQRFHKVGGLDRSVRSLSIHLSKSGVESFVFFFGSGDLVILVLQITLLFVHCRSSVC